MSWFGRRSVVECSVPVDTDGNRSWVLAVITDGNRGRGLHQKTLPVGGHSVTSRDWNRLLLRECRLKKSYKGANPESRILAHMNGHECSIWSEIVKLTALTPPSGLRPALRRDRPFSDCR